MREQNGKPVAKKHYGTIERHVQGMFQSADGALPLPLNPARALLSPADWAMIGKALSLPERQRQVAQLTLEGLTREAVAARLGIDDDTVRTHLRRVYARLGVTERTAFALQIMYVYLHLSGFLATESAKRGEATPET